MAAFLITLIVLSFHSSLQRSISLITHANCAELGDSALLCSPAGGDSLVQAEASSLLQGRV